MLEFVFMVIEYLSIAFLSGYMHNVSFLSVIYNNKLAIIYRENKHLYWVGCQNIPACQGQVWSSNFLNDF